MFACQTAYFKYLFVSHLIISLNQFVLWRCLKYSCGLCREWTSNICKTVWQCLPILKDNEDLEPEKCLPSFVMIHLFHEDGRHIQYPTFRTLPAQGQMKMWIRSLKRKKHWNKHVMCFWVKFFFSTNLFVWLIQKAFRWLTFIFIQEARQQENL